MKISISTGIVAGALLAVAALPSAFGESDTAALGAHLHEYGTIVRSLRGSTPDEADDEEQRSPVNLVEDLFKIESLEVAPISQNGEFQQHLAKELLSRREVPVWYRNAKKVERDTEYAAFNHLEEALGKHDLAVMIHLVRSKKLKVSKDARKMIKELEKEQFSKWVKLGRSKDVVSEAFLGQPEETSHRIVDEYAAYVQKNKRKEGYIWTP